MKELNPEIDENKLWRICFPHTFALCQKEPAFIACSPEEMAKRQAGSALLMDPIAQAEVRLDKAIAALWPIVSTEFIVDFFPHRLAAATDILRALDFGQGKEPHIAALVGELSLALDGLERTLADIDTKED